MLSIDELHKGGQFGGGCLGENIDIRNKSGDDFWGYMVGSIDESLYLGNTTQVNHSSPSQSGSLFFQLSLTFLHVLNPLGLFVT